MTSKRSATPRQQMLTDLARSGLTEADAKRLKLEPLSAAATHRLTRHYRAASYRIPYLDHKGNDTGFYRLRFTDPVKRFRDDSMLRYWQPPDTTPGVYLPHGAVKSWAAVLGNARVPLWLTEGEKKAAATSKAGVACLGLGGVWAWRSKRNKQEVLPILKAVDWTDREVTLAFDSDLQQNAMVLGALHSLARWLTDQGAVVRLAFVPGRPEAKRGVDDYLVDGGELEKLPAEPFADYEVLWQLNHEVAVIRNAAAVYDFHSEKLFSRKQLTDVVLADRSFTRWGADGKPREVQAADAWLKWPRRTQYDDLTYRPGEPRVLDGTLNLWQGWGVDPEPGDVSPFLELLDYFFKDAPATDRAWFEAWLAYPLQHPGTKLYTAVLLTSPAFGTGKSLIGYTMGKIYGRNFTTVGSDELSGQFNDWARNKQFVLGEELTSADKRKDAERLKYIVTRDRVTINQKYQPPYTLPDCINYLLTSNHPDALYLEPGERRFFVHEMLRPPLPQRFYDRYDAWLKGDGAANLFGYLLHQVDTSWFNPKAAAPLTDGKDRMTELSASDLDLFARQLKTDPDAVLRFGDDVVTRELWTIDELTEVIDPGGARRTTKIALTKALRRAGFRQLEPTRTAQGVRKLWAVRRQTEWLNATHAARAQAYDQGHAGPVAVEDAKRRIKY